MMPNTSTRYEEVYYIHNGVFLGRAEQTLQIGPKMASESKERRLGRVLWWLGVRRGEGSRTRGQGLVWFESPAVTKGGGSQAFLSACPDVGNNGKGVVRRKSCQ